jgi:hypothetical protein
MPPNNMASIRRNQRLAKHLAGRGPRVAPKQRLVKPRRRAAQPAQILSEAELRGGEAEASVELNTWSSQAAYETALHSTMDDGDGDGDGGGCAVRPGRTRRPNEGVVSGTLELDRAGGASGAQQQQHTPGLFMEVRGRAAAVASGGGVAAQARALRSDLWHAALHGDVQTVRHLVEVRCVAPADARNGWGQTPLHCAARNGHAAVVLALLRAGARTWLREQEHCTPLHLAASFGHVACVRLLLLYGASTSAVNALGLTPLGEALERGSVAGVRGEGAREASELLRQAMAELPDGLRQRHFEDPRLPPAYRTYWWDEWGGWRCHHPAAAGSDGLGQQQGARGSAGEQLEAKREEEEVVVRSAPPWPDEEDGFGGEWGVSAILKRVHGQAPERRFFERFSGVAALGALAPMAVTLPLLLLFRGGGGGGDSEAVEAEEQSWVGSGGRGMSSSWGCCLPWQPTFYAVVAVLLPQLALPLLAEPLRSHACRARELPAEPPCGGRGGAGAGGLRTRWLAIWAVGLVGALAAAAAVCAAAAGLRSQGGQHSSWVHVLICALNYGLLALVRGTGERLLAHQTRMVREAVLVRPTWAVTTVHTMLALLLPPLLLPPELAAADPPPLHCCITLDYGHAAASQPPELRHNWSGAAAAAAPRAAAHLHAVEDYSAGINSWPQRLTTNRCAVHRRRAGAQAGRQSMSPIIHSPALCPCFLCLSPPWRRRRRRRRQVSSPSSR